MRWGRRMEGLEGRKREGDGRIDKGKKTKR